MLCALFTYAVRPSVRLSRRSTAAAATGAFAAERPASKLYTQGEVTSQNLWSQYDRHFVGITRHNAVG